MRIGLGIDTHQLIAGSQLKLCGITIPFNKKIKAHSDGDIIYHACADAIYGAASLGDIGEHFPDSDPMNKDLNSETIILHSYKLISELGFKVNNIDITIMLEAPKLTPYKEKMIQNLAYLLKIANSSVNIKASTSESLGFIGKGEGVTCYCIVSLVK